MSSLAADEEDDEEEDDEEEQRHPTTADRSNVANSLKVVDNFVLKLSKF